MSKRDPQQDQIDKLTNETGYREYSMSEIVDSLDPSRVNQKYYVSYDFSSSGGSVFGSKSSEDEDGLPKISNYK